MLSQNVNFKRRSLKTIIQVYEVWISFTNDIFINVYNKQLYSSLTKNAQ